MKKCKTVRKKNNRKQSKKQKGGSETFAQRQQRDTFYREEIDKVLTKGATLWRQGKHSMVKPGTSPNYGKCAHLYLNKIKELQNDNNFPIDRGLPKIINIALATKFEEDKWNSSCAGCPARKLSQALVEIKKKLEYPSLDLPEAFQAPKRPSNNTIKDNMNIGTLRDKEILEHFSGNSWSKLIISVQQLIQGANGDIATANGQLIRHLVALGIPQNQEAMLTNLHILFSIGATKIAEYLIQQAQK